MITSFIAYGEFSHINCLIKGIEAASIKAVHYSVFSRHTTKNRNLETIIGSEISQQ